MVTQTQKNNYSLNIPEAISNILQKAMDNVTDKSFQDICKAHTLYKGYIDKPVDSFNELAQKANLGYLKNLPDDIKKEIELAEQALAESPEETVTSVKDVETNSTSPDLSKLLQREIDFYRTAGPFQFDQNMSQFTFRTPAGARLDVSSGQYKYEITGLDPSLKLNNFRHYVLHYSRQVSMCSEGRLHFYRAIVAVGNGNGIYGFGVGYGSNGPDARADAVVRALGRLEYLDMDNDKLLHTSVHGRHAKMHCRLYNLQAFANAGKERNSREPRRGLGSNLSFTDADVSGSVSASHRYLPVAYLIGLRNVKLQFSGRGGIVVKITALRRALEAVTSRATIARSTGMRYIPLHTPTEQWLKAPMAWWSLGSVARDVHLCDARVSAVGQRFRELALAISKTQ